MYPGSVLHYKGKFRKSSVGKVLRLIADFSNVEAIENIRGEDFDIRHNDNFDPFSFLGNGELEWERDEGADLAFYLQ